jgi:MFS family permease
MVLSMLTLMWLDIPRSTAEAHGGGRPLASIAAQPVFVVALVGGMFGYGLMSLVMTATPLAMHAHDYPFGDTAFVIQWHVLGMFAPSFVTGHLIRRFGVLQVMLTGVLLIALCAMTNLAGTALVNYSVALALLGVGWNFLFIGSTTLLTEAYRPEEKARAQALNDFVVFTTVTMAVLSAGSLQHRLGWRAVNLGVLPLTLIPLTAIVWLMRARRAAASPALVS